MALPTLTPTLSRDVGERDGSSVLWTWACVTATPDGVPCEYTEWSDKTWQVVGTNWGGATLVIQGSNDYNPTTGAGNFFTMNNAAGGTALSFTTGAVQGFTSLETPRWVRPNLSVAGTAAVVTVSLLGRRNTPLRTR